MDRRGRTIVAAIDAVLMGAVAFAQTGVPTRLDAADVILWGSALASAICAFVIYTNGVAMFAWAAIGYVLFGALLTGGAPHWPLVALAVALMPLVQRPRGSLASGLGIAVLFALALRLLAAAIL